MGSEDIGSDIDPDDIGSEDIGSDIEPDDMSCEDMGSDIDDDIGSDDMGSEDIGEDVMAALVIGVVALAEDAVEPDEPQATSAMARTPPAATAEIFLSNMSCTPR